MLRQKQLYLYNPATNDQQYIKADLKILDYCTFCKNKINHLEERIIEVNDYFFPITIKQAFHKKCIKYWK